MFEPSFSLSSTVFTAIIAINSCNVTQLYVTKMKGKNLKIHGDSRDSTVVADKG